MSNATPTRCPNCGAERPADALAGLCPRCLLQQGLDLGPNGSRALTEPGSAPSASVLATLAATMGPFPRIVLRDAARDGDTPVSRPTAPERPRRPTEPGRYQLVGEIARGGMGAIFKGRDVDLGRDLAVKVLLEAHRDD